MTLRRRSNVNDVWASRSQHFLQIGKACGNAKTFPQLLGHERFQIANGDNLAIGNSTNGVHMLVRDLTATDERDP